jgi:hypothetical protein
MQPSASLIRLYYRQLHRSQYVIYLLFLSDQLICFMYHSLATFRRIYFRIWRDTASSVCAHFKLLFSQVHTILPLGYVEVLMIQYSHGESC